MHADSSEIWVGSRLDYPGYVVLSPNSDISSPSLSQVVYQYVEHSDFSTDAFELALKSFRQPLPTSSLMFYC